MSWMFPEYEVQFWTLLEFLSLFLIYVAYFVIDDNKLNTAIKSKNKAER